LWHPPVVCWVTAHFGTGQLGFFIYFPISLLLGIIATVAIEEPCLKLKNRYFNTSPTR
jgi:peptidoglycan/LPS O-acetylase OafA/YrhL